MTRQQTTAPAPQREILRIPTDEVALFSSASHDRNPLHMDAEYAHRTPYGAPVVFGMLAVLRGLARGRERSGQQLTRLVLELRSPVFADTPYEVSVAEADDADATLMIKDGERLLLRGRAAYAPSLDPVPAVSGRPTVREEAAARDADQIVVGTVVRGRYQPDPDGVRRLVDGLELEARGMFAGHVALLSLLSYLVGMELPGRRALFSAVELDITGGLPDAAALLDYDLEATAFDTRLGLARLRVDVRCGQTQIASAQLRAFVRSDVPTLAPAARDQLLAPSRTLGGKTALVIGGSRGLGATIAYALASQGAHVVVGYRRSHAQAQQLVRDTEHLPGAIELHAGDAGDRAWCAAMCRQVSDTHGGLDVLVSNATHSLQPLSLHPLTVDRLNAYVHDSVRLVSVPLAHARDLLAARAGCHVVVSSAFVNEPAREWPHYVSAKAAIEALGRVVALQERRISTLLVRPPRLRTDLSNTALGMHGAIAPEVVAASLARRLLHPPASGAVEVLDRFEQARAA